MILTCPECATRFSVESDAIGPNGRTVRCSNCSATWFASADPDILSLNDIQNTPVIDDLGENDLQKDDIENGFPKEESELESPLQPNQPHAVIRDKADRRKVRRRLFSVGMIWVTALGILAIAAIISVLFRSQVVERFPATQSMYDAVGIKASKTGLEIYNIRTEYGNIDGISVLFIKGEIKNYDQRTRDVPIVQMKFKNGNNETLASWAIDPPKSVLTKGETQSFSGEYPNPPVDATKLVPVFVNELASAPNVPEQEK